MDFLLGLVALQAPADPGSTEKEKARANGVSEGTSGSHCRRVYRLLQRIVQHEWHSIPDPASEKWLADFRLRVAHNEPLVPNPLNARAASAPKSYSSDATTTREGDTRSADASLFEDFSSQEEFLLLNKDTPWVQALRRLRAIKESERSRPLEMNEVVNYAKRLAGSVAAPPETGNIVDVVAHQSAFPAYHFLPYPSMEELQNSRLAALAAKPYADICFPPEVTARVVHLRRDAAYLPTPSFNTSLISDDAWRNGDSREVFYELKFTCATPCCSFWFAIADGQWSASQPLPREYPVRQLSSFKPLLVPGPFPKTVRVQCRKPGKNHSRFTQTCLKLKGAAAAWTSLPAGASPMGQRRCATSGQAGPGSSVSTTEATGAERDAKTAPPSTAEQSGVSQFHGLMLGAARRRVQQRRQESSSESSSGSSSDGD